MKALTINEAQASFLAMLAKVKESGEPVVITQNGQPIADIVPHKHADSLAFNKALSTMPIIDGFDDTEIFVRVDSTARDIDWTE